MREYHKKPRIIIVGKYNNSYIYINLIYILIYVYIYTMAD